jgi:protein SCO1/2
MTAVLALLILLTACLPVRAGLTDLDLTRVDVTLPSDARVPLSLTLFDETGDDRTLGSIIDGRPTALLLADYTCETLCGAVTTIVASAIASAGLRPGQDISALVVGIDSADGPAEAALAKSTELASSTDLEAGVPFLSGDPAAIGELTAALGYHYVYDAERDQFAHPPVLFILAGDGRVARVLPGLTVTSRDLRLALVEAGRGRIGTVVDQIRLLCYGYDPVRGVYTPMVMTMLRVGGVVAVIGLSALVLLLRRRSRMANRAEPA